MLSFRILYVLALAAFLGLASASPAARHDVRTSLKTREGTSLSAAIVMRQASSTGNGTKTIVAKSGDTFSKLAAQFGVGICDIVKASGVKDPNLITVGQTLTIPPPTNTPDNTSCLPPPAPPATERCVLGGPDRLVIPAAGLSVAQATGFLNITLEAFTAANAAMLSNVTSAEQAGAANLTGGSVMSVPVCPNSQCTISQGTVKAGDIFNDIAAAAGTTTGQILALNPGIDRLNLAVGQTFTLASNCRNVTGNAGNASANATAAAVARRVL